MDQGQGDGKRRRRSNEREGVRGGERAPAVPCCCSRSSASHSHQLPTPCTRPLVCPPSSHITTSLGLGSSINPSHTAAPPCNQSCGGEGWGHHEEERRSELVASRSLRHPLLRLFSTHRWTRRQSPPPLFGARRVWPRRCSSGPAGRPLLWPAGVHAPWALGSGACAISQVP